MKQHGLGKWKKSYELLFGIKWSLFWFLTYCLAPKQHLQILHGHEGNESTGSVEWINGINE